MQHVLHNRVRTGGRAAQQARQQEQIKQHRVRHRRTDFLADLEARWAALAAGT
jgi:hypothetical protein